MKPSIPFKVACGYVLVTGLFLVGLYAIYLQSQSLSELSENEKTIADRRKATHLLICKILEAENIAQTVHLGHKEGYLAYEASLHNVQLAIVGIDTLMTDSMQKARLDTLSILLEQRKRNLLQLLQTMDSQSFDKVYHEKISSLLAKNDTVIKKPQIARKIIQSEKSYTVQKPKKKFFQRLAEAFRPHSTDTTKVNQSTQVLAVDTLEKSYNTADTLANLLTDIEKEVHLSKIQRKSQLKTQIEQLNYVGIELSYRLAQLLESIEQDEQQWIQSETDKAIEARQHATLIMGSVTLCAILLSIVFFMLVRRDNNRSNHYRKALEQAKEKAEELLLARERLMLTITHDIKAPTGSILGYTDLLTPLITEKKQSFYLNNIKSAANHLLNLVNSLLDYHRLEAQKMDLQSISFDPHQLMEDIYNGFLPAANKKGLNLTFNYQAQTECTCRADAFRIRQITENLLSNALKFTKKGQISLSVKLTNKEIEFSVSDTGCGMTNEEQVRIFQAFTRLRSAQGEEGFGLGLSITKKLVELLHGTINLQSTPGKGSCFTVKLPVECTPAVSASSSSNLPEKGSEPLSTISSALHILLIDDDRIQLELTKAMIEQICPPTTDKSHAWQVTCCTQPEEVFKCLDENEPDLLLTDIQMPALNGFELMKQLYQKGFTTLPVIAITARQDLHEEDFKAQHFATCLYKPFNISELLTAIHKATGINVSATSTTVPQKEKTSKGFNFSALTTFAGDDEEAAKEILNTFLNESITHEQQLAEALKTNNHSDICQLAHKLLPTFTLIGANVISDMQMLDNARHQNENWTKDHQQAAHHILEALREVINNEELKKISDGI